MTTPGGSARGRALVSLRESYTEAQEFVSGIEPHAHLQWILGTKRSPDHTAESFDTRMLEVVVLWLEDLALEVDRSVTTTPAEGAAKAEFNHQSRRSVAARLRAATEAFAVAFRRL